MSSFSPGALAILAKVLNLPPLTTEASLYLSAQEIPTLTVTRLLTEKEINDLADAYVTEGIEAFPTGTTTYSLVPRSEAVDDAEPVE
jgi:hypothetical protein